MSAKNAITKVGRAGGKALSKVDPAAAVTDIVTALMDYKKTVQVERTKRRGIEAALERERERIRSLERIVMTYLDRQFAERAELFRRQFDLADQALEKGDVQGLAVVVQSLTEIAKVTPFEGLADLAATRSVLGDGETVWEL